MARLLAHPRSGPFGAPKKKPTSPSTPKKSVDTVMPIAPDWSVMVGVVLGGSVGVECV